MWMWWTDGDGWPDARHRRRWHGRVQVEDRPNGRSSQEQVVKLMGSQAKGPFPNLFSDRRDSGPESWRAHGEFCPSCLQIGKNWRILTCKQMMRPRRAAISNYCTLTQEARDAGCGHHLRPAQVVARADLPHRTGAGLCEHPGGTLDAQQDDLCASGPPSRDGCGNWS